MPKPSVHEFQLNLTEDIRPPGPIEDLYLGMTPEQSAEHAEIIDGPNNPVNATQALMKVIGNERVRAALHLMTPEEPTEEKPATPTYQTPIRKTRRKVTGRTALVADQGPAHIYRWRD